MEGVIVGLLGGILAVMIGSFSALWYRLGRAEGILNELRDRVGRVEGILNELRDRVGRVEGILNEHLREHAKGKGNEGDNRAGI